MRLRAAIAVLLALPAPALAGSRSMMTRWMVEEAAAPAEPFDVAREDYVLKSRLVPSGLVELTAAPAGGDPEGFGPGKQLIEIETPDALVFCDPAIRAQKLIGHAQLCFVDGDRDGRLEGVFATTSVTKGILTVEGNRPKQPRAIGPIPYRRLDPGQFDQALFVGLQYRGSANIASNHVFEIRYGGADQTGTLTQRIVHKKEQVPGSRDFLGGRFTLLGADAGKIRVRVDRALPRQPFGVTKVTTYHFY